MEETAKKELASFVKIVGDMETELNIGDTGGSAVL